MLQYPFCYLGFNPPQGSSKIYRYEDFNGSSFSFKFISEINPNPTVYMIPQNYRGKTGDSLNDSATLNGYPQVASRVDVYNSWLAQNSGIINVQQKQEQINYAIDKTSSTLGLITSIGGTIGGALNGNSISGLSGIADNALNLTRLDANHQLYIQMLNAQKEKQAMLPDNVSLGGSNATLLGYELIDDAVFTQYSIKQQFARRLDSFFDAFGYETDEFKIPNTNNRKYWNYVKTNGANIQGYIPQEAIQTLKNIFDNGVTLWHDTSHFMDYSQDNRESIT